MKVPDEEQSAVCPGVPLPHPGTRGSSPIDRTSLEPETGTVLTHQKFTFPHEANPSTGELQSLGVSPDDAQNASGAHGTSPSILKYILGSSLPCPAVTGIKQDTAPVEVEVEVEVSVPTTSGWSSPDPQPSSPARKPTNARFERLFIFRSPFLRCNFPHAERDVKLSFPVS
jgi:hypothetical protein